MEAERYPTTRAKSLVTFLGEATGPAISRVALQLCQPRPSEDAYGFLLKTWRGGLDAGKPKLSPIARGPMERGLMR